ncbi:MAG: undecaprenyldiphospho-muramoylpentapeptide beta-N-acetylglucosaminyltransferase, partial [Deltaproteobacteria bacterium RBG_13_52_11]
MTGKVVIAGGGTGGHLFPGIALAEEFTRRKEGWEVIFIGTGKELERRILSRWGFELITIPAAPLKGRRWWGKIAGITTLLLGVWWSLALLRRISPRLVIGLGGYSAGAVLIAAYLLGIKRVIQEQNVHPGFTNRMASRFSQRVFLSWAEGACFFPAAKVKVTGNPLRRRVLEDRGKKREGKGFTLLILGGSQGATAINRAMIEALPPLKDIKKDLSIIHQTGAADHRWVKEGYEKADFQATVYPFIDEMAPCYREAHLTICRAGAATITELCAWGRASLMIPYPYAADDHQRKNAEVVVRQGAGRMIPDQELSGKRLAQEILLLYHDRRALKEMEKEAAALGQPDATAR